jgi:hypothetical protein
MQLLVFYPTRIEVRIQILVWFNVNALVYLDIDALLGTQSERNKFSLDVR